MPAVDQHRSAESPTARPSTGRAAGLSAALAARLPARVRAIAERYLSHLASARDYRKLWVAVPLCAGIAWTVVHVLLGSMASYAVLACIITLNFSHARAWRSGMSFVTAMALSMITAHVARGLIGVNGISIGIVIAVGLTAAWMLGIGADGAGFATVNSALIFTGAGTSIEVAQLRLGAMVIGAVIGIAGSKILLSRLDPVATADAAVSEHARKVADLLHDMARGLQESTVGDGKPGEWLSRARELTSAEDVKKLIDSAREEAKLGLIGPDSRRQLRAVEARWEALSTDANRARRMARTVHDLGTGTPMPAQVVDAVGLAADAVIDGVMVQRVDDHGVAEALRDAPTGAMLAAAALASDAKLIVDGHSDFGPVTLHRNHLLGTAAR